jgi:hypothetical protein
VRHILEIAVCGQDAVLIFAAEEGDLDLLSLVLVRLVLHSEEPSRFPLSCALDAWVQAATGKKGVR